MQAVINQRFPTSGALARNTNVSLSLLRAVLKGQDGAAYAYIVDTVEFVGGQFEQTGSGPNFQGDLITLTTCKHQMRSALEQESWPGVWIAGFTRIDAVPGAHVNYLVFLAKVRNAFASQRDLWNALPPTVRELKAADEHRLGDVYRPLSPESDPFDPRGYVTPRADHPHCHDNGWHEDIDYVSAPYGRRPSLLVADPEHSFLWSTPLIALPGRTHPRTKKHELRQLLGDLVNRPLRGSR